MIGPTYISIRSRGVGPPRMFSAHAVWHAGSGRSDDTEAFGTDLKLKRRVWRMKRSGQHSLCVPSTKRAQHGGGIAHRVQLARIIPPILIRVIATFSGLLRVNSTIVAFFFRL